MTLRLSALFESQIKSVVSNWKSARRRANKNKSRGSSSSPSKRTLSERTRSSGRRGATGRNTRRIRSSEESSHNDDNDDDNDNDDDDDDDNENNELPRGSQRSRGRMGQTRSGSGGATASTSSSNRVTSSSSHRRTNALDEQQPGTSRSSRRINNSHEIDHDADDDDEDVEEDVEATASSSDSQDGDDSSSEESISDNSASENSEDSYSPEKDRKKRGCKRHHHRSGRKSNRSRGTKRRRHPDEDTDEDFDVDNHKKHTKSGRKGRKPKSCTRRGRSGVLSQIDESTQDTLSNTPKKKGRPPKTPRNDDGPSASAVVALMLQSPSRSTRNQIVSQTSSIGVGVGRRATENDHSYHLPVRNGRIIESDTDSREVAARPTRASVKRAILEWARGSEIEDGEGTEEAEEVSKVVE